MLIAGGTVSWFPTVTEIDFDVATFPLVSVAMAVITCDPSATVVVSQLTEYGDALSAEQRSPPSIWNCTLATAWLSLASAVTATAPATVESALGAVMATEGGVVSGLYAVTVIELEVVLFPAVSVAIAVIVCVLFFAVVLSHAIW